MPSLDIKEIEAAANALGHKLVVVKASSELVVQDALVLGMHPA
jgi:hypothetical protein